MSRPRYAYHLAPGDEATRSSIRRFGLLPECPRHSGRWGNVDDDVSRNPRAVYAWRAGRHRPVPPVGYDLYRIALPLGLRTYHDGTIWDEVPESWGQSIIIRRRVPPVWIAFVSSG